MSKQAHQEKQSYLEMFEGQLREWDARLDFIKAKAGSLKADAKIEFQRQLVTLQQKRQEAGAKLEDLYTRTDVAWDDLKEGTETAWRDLWRAMERVAARFR